MAWTDIPFPTADDLSRAADFWTPLKDDLTYLHRPNYAAYHHPGTGSDYTVSTSIAQDLDSTNFKLTIDKQIDESLVVACFYGQIATTGGSSTRMNIVHENPQNTGRNLIYDFKADIFVTTTSNRGWFQFFPNLSAGLHTFTVVWGNASGTGTLAVAYRPFFAVWEKGK